MPSPKKKGRFSASTTTAAKETKITTIDLDQLVPDPANARRHTDRNRTAVDRSLQTFGAARSLVADGKGVVRAGNQTLESAKKAGITKAVVIETDGRELIVVKRHDWSATEAAAYALADNRTAELAEWNNEVLAAQLGALTADGFDLGLVGFEADEVAQLLGSAEAAGRTDPDAIPDPPDAATTKRGDIWLLGDHRLMCGNSADDAELDRLLDGVKVHLVNTDPPYNVKVEPRSNNAIAAGLSSFEKTGVKQGRELQNQRFLKVQRAATHHQRFDAARRPSVKEPTHRKLRAKDRPLANDFVSDAEFEKLLAGWFGNIGRVLRAGHAFYIWGGYANCSNYPPALKAAGLYLSQAIIWVKEHAVLTRKDFMGNHEWCFYGWREGAAHRFFGAANVPDTWELQRTKSAGYQIGRGIRIATAGGSQIDLLPANPDRKLRTITADDAGVIVQGPAEPTDLWRVKKVTPQAMVHLTEKPVELAARALHYSSQPGEHVLDLFGGSGSTLIAAEQLHRRAYLMELDPPYCDVIVRRYEQFTGRKAERITA
jgi:DNA modification methylase